MSGEDERRNDTIVRAVSEYAAQGQVLLFANSVWHASHLAALLQFRGTEAASVHVGTETSAQQYFIRQFQGGMADVAAIDPATISRLLAASSPFQHSAGGL
jgi:superfamily II helicase